MKKLFLLLIASTMMAFTQQREFCYDNPPDASMFGMGTMLEKLDLTLDQQKQFEKLQTEMQKKQIDLRSKTQSLKLDMKNLCDEDSLNKSSIESKINEVSKLQSEMKMNHLNFWFAVNNILKPEQQKTWRLHLLMVGRDAEWKMHDRMRKQMGRHLRWMERGGR